MNGCFFNYQNKQEYHIWAAWQEDRMLLDLLLFLVMLQGNENMLIRIVVFFSSKMII